MKCAGKGRGDTANRKIRGTSMACPCCIPRANWEHTSQDFHKRDRQAAKAEIDAQLVENVFCVSCQSSECHHVQPFPGEP